MVTAVTLALAITFEPMEEKVMQRPPRKPDEPILGRLFIWRIVFVSFLIGALTFWVFKHMGSLGVEEEVKRTVAVNTLVAGQLFYLFNCRKIKLPSLGKGFFNNKYAFIAAGALILLQVFFAYTPFMNNFFGTAPIEASLWLYPLIAGIAVFFIVELEKYVVGMFNK
jgi:magnesium-transporting ATPase (P-type)